MLFCRLEVSPELISTACTYLMHSLQHLDTFIAKCMASWLPARSAVGMSCTHCLLAHLLPGHWFASSTINWCCSLAPAFVVLLLPVLLLRVLKGLTTCRGAIRMSSGADAVAASYSAMHTDRAATGCTQLMSVHMFLTPTT